MTRRTKAEWQALIAAQQKSGLSATDFCRERGLNANYFCRVRRRLIEAENKAPPFVPVSVLQPSSEEKVTVRCAGGVTIDLPLGIEPRWVSQLLLALRD